MYITVLETHGNDRSNDRLCTPQYMTQANSNVICNEHMSHDNNATSETPSTISLTENKLSRGDAMEKALKI